MIAMLIFMIDNLKISAYSSAHVYPEHVIHHGEWSPFLFPNQSEVDTETGEALDTLAPVCTQQLEQLGSKCTKVSEVIQTKDKVIFDAIDEGLEKANRQATSNAQTVKKWRLLDGDFSMPGGELGEGSCVFMCV